MLQKHWILCKANMREPGFEEEKIIKSGERVAMIDEERILEALQSILHPKLKKPLVDLGMIRNIVVRGEEVKLTLALQTDHGPLKENIVRKIDQTIKTLSGISHVDVNVTTLSQKEIELLFPELSLKGIEKVCNIVAVASGKGGVGKTTLAVNLAFALAGNGYKVGLLDADVYGPSVPLMLAMSEALEQKEGMILPKEKYGLRFVSLGMTAGQNEAFVWRGPIVSKTIRQLLGQVKWGKLDYLIIDLPPGTGDPSITVAQAIPHCSILMITTPQEVALADVRRAIGLFQKTGQAVVGLVENMSYFLCGHSEKPIEIFGHGGGEKLSKETGIPLLGAIPFDLKIGRGGDSGVPLLVSAPDSETGRIFQQVAKALSEKIKKSCQ